eukprot:g8088.t1.2.5e17418a g8088  g8088.t1 contig27:163628-167782(+)
MDFDPVKINKPHRKGSHQKNRPRGKPVQIPQPSDGGTHRTHNNDPWYDGMNDYDDDSNSGSGFSHAADGGSVGERRRSSRPTTSRGENDRKEKERRQRQKEACTRSQQQRKETNVEMSSDEDEEVEPNRHEPGRSFDGISLGGGESEAKVASWKNKYGVQEGETDIVDAVKSRKRWKRANHHGPSSLTEVYSGTQQFQRIRQSERSRHRDLMVSRSSHYEDPLDEARALQDHSPRHAQRREMQACAATSRRGKSETATQQMSRFMGMLGSGGTARKYGTGSTVSNRSRKSSHKEGGISSINGNISIHEGFNSFIPRKRNSSSESAQSTSEKKRNNDVFDQVDEAPIAPQKKMSHQHAIDVDKSSRSDDLSFSEHTNAREEEVDIEGALASVNNEYVAAKSSFGAIKRVRDGREARKVTQGTPSDVDFSTRFTTKQKDVIETEPHRGSGRKRPDIISKRTQKGKQSDPTADRMRSSGMAPVEASSIADEEWMSRMSESDKKKKKQLKRIQLQSRIPSLISSQTSLPSSRKSGRLSGKGKKREGASENNAIEIEDSSSSSDDESVDSDSTEAVGEVPKANAAEVNARKRESIGMKTRSGRGRGRKVLIDAENKLLLVYPFKGADEEMLAEASTGLKELSGHHLGVKDEMDVEEVEATANDSSDQNDDEATVEVKGSARAHYVTICQEDYNRLEPGQFLNDSLVDFWMRWISREQSHLGNKSDVHFFTSHFMSTLEEENDPSSVASWTKKKKIDIFKKKLIFVPVNADLHWSLCVIVNPGLLYQPPAKSSEASDAMDVDTEDETVSVELMDTEDEAEAKEGSCILFLDSLKMHRKDKVARIIRKWLDFEWKRKHGIEDPKQKFFISRDMQLLTPKIPYQENGCDCGVFVCRYAYGLYLMRRQLFTPEDINDNFKGMITNGSAFAFDMKDIARIRGEFTTLIDRLSPKYLAIKDAEEKAAKRAKKKAVAGETTVEKAVTVAASSEENENTPQKMAAEVIGELTTDL